MLDKLNHWINEKLRQFSIAVLGLDPYAFTQVQRFMHKEEEEKEEAEQDV